MKPLDADSLDRHRVLSTSQVAELMNVSLSHLRRLYWAGTIPKPMRVGARKLGWTKGAVLDQLQSNAA